MGKLILHVGVGKTGTTSLQENLFNKLPSIACLGRPNHSEPLARDFTYAMTYAEDFEVRRYAKKFHEKVERELEKRTVIISNEGFTSSLGIQSVTAKRLHDIFPDAEVVISIRNQFDILKSYYLNQGKHLHMVPAAEKFNKKHAIGFEEFISYALSRYDYEFARVIQYDRLVESYLQFYSKSQLKIILFEEMLIDPDKFFSHFAQLFDIELKELTSKWLTAKPVNQAVTGRALLYNKIRTKIPIPSLRKLFLLSAGVSSRIDRYLSSGKRANIEFNEQSRQSINSIYSAGNQKISKLFNLDLEKYNYPLHEKVNG